MVAWPVPESDAFPVGITYRFQYMDAAGDTLLRIANPQLTLDEYRELEAGLAISPRDGRTDAILYDRRPRE